MIIDLCGLISQTGLTKEYVIPIEMDSFKSTMGEYQIKSKKDLTLTFKNTGKKTISLNSKLDIVFTVPCDRCLMDVDTHINLDSERDINFGEESENADELLEDMSFIEGTAFDTERYVYCEILENFPMKVLCKDGCKGICTVCGCNLNEGECNCDRTVLDPRMAKIKDIFKQFNSKN